jgi:hypothetical protein
MINKIKSHIMFLWLLLFCSIKVQQFIQRKTYVEFVSGNLITGDHNWLKDKSSPDYLLNELTFDELCDSYPKHMTIYFDAIRTAFLSGLWEFSDIVSDRKCPIFSNAKFIYCNETHYDVIMNCMYREFLKTCPKIQ